MSLRTEILEKIPDYLKEEPECKTLLEYIKAQGIKTNEELSAYLKKEIAMVEEWLLENKKRGGTMVKSLRDKAVELGVLKKCEELAEKFLS